MEKNIYIASPFFNEEELSALRIAEEILINRGFEIFSPRLMEQREGDIKSPKWSKTTFLMDKEGIDRCDCMVMLYWGNYSDTGTAWEGGYAFAIGKPVIVVHLGTDSNLMVHEGSHTSLYGTEALKSYDFDSMQQTPYTGKMY